MLEESDIQILVIHDDPIDENEMRMVVMQVLVFRKWVNVEDDPLITCFIQAIDKGRGV